MYFHSGTLEHWVHF